MISTISDAQPHPALTDEQAIARVLSGDTPAFELIMRRHNQRLYRIARSVITDNDEAEDIVQDAYVRAYANLSKFQGRSTVATWLSRITLHEALRRRKRTARASVTDDLDTTQTSHSPPPDANANRSELSALLTSAIDTLPAPQRVVVMLRLVQGLSTRDTAECLRISEANVKTSLHRARALLAESIQQSLAPEFSRQHTFDGHRCDRIVAGVLHRITATPPR